LKVGNTNIISVVKYSALQLHTFMTPMVWLCNQNIISLTAFSHRIFKHETIVKQNISRENIRQCFTFSVAVRMFTFLLSSQFY